MEGSESMEARARCLILLIALLPALGASARTRNFIVTAPTQALADEIAQAAETFRRDLAYEWLERELPPWHRPCPLVAKVNPQLGAGGRTSFMFEQRVPYGWDMEVQGSRERILDSVLPHEITHTIFATHFGRPLPRWADEGACTTVEHHQERRKQEEWLIRFLKTERGIPFNKMFAMTEYPGDILPLYSQGYSVARYLIAQGGKPKFVQFVGRGMDTGNWTFAVQQFYGYRTLGELQLTWVEWVKQGSPPVSPNSSSPALLASTGTATQASATQASANTSATTASSSQGSAVAAPVSPIRPVAQPKSQPVRPLIDTDAGELTARVPDQVFPTGKSWYARRLLEAPDPAATSPSPPPIYFDAPTQNRIIR